MMRSPARVILALCVSAASLIGATPVRADPDWEARFRAEGVPAWEAALAEQSRIQGQYRLTVTTDGQTEAELELERKSNDECALGRETDRKTGVSEVFGYNPRYTFHIRSSPERGWMLVSAHIGDPASDPTYQEVRRRAVAIARVGELGLRAPFGNDTLPTYLGAPRTRVVSVTPGAGGLVELRLDLNPATKDERLRAITTAFDPARAWRPTRTTASGQNRSNTCEITAEYQYADGAAPLLRHVREAQVWTLADGKTMRIVRDLSCDLKLLTTLPDTSEFTLTAFGLPEPVGVVWPRRSNTWVWFVAAGVGLVLATLVFRRLSRRAAARRAAAA